MPNLRPPRLRPCVARGERDNSEIKDVVHLTFFSKEPAPGGTPYHSFARVIIRDTEVLYAR